MSLSVSYGNGGIAIQRHILVSSQSCALALLFLAFVWSWRLNEKVRQSRKASSPWIDFTLCFLIFACSLGSSLHLQEINPSAFSLAVLCTVSSSLLWIYSMFGLFSSPFRMSQNKSILSNVLAGVLLIIGICFCESAYVRLVARACADQTLIYFDGFLGIATSIFAALHISGLATPKSSANHNSSRISGTLNSESSNDTNIPFLTEEELEEDESDFHRLKHDDADVF